MSAVAISLGFRRCAIDSVIGAGSDGHSVRYLVSDILQNSRTCTIYHAGHRINFVFEAGTNDAEFV